MTNSHRVEWVDYAKGLCIILIVMMHSTLGVEEAVGEEGWLHAVVAFAKPFRMPDFFLIAGLFLARAIDRDWRHYLDKKAVHYAYFYLLWLVINFVFKAPGMAAESGWGSVGESSLLSLIDPFGVLWFIYVLPIFFVAAKLLRAVPCWIVWLAAAALEILPINTGWMVIDESASRFVYFYTGYIFAPHVFRFAQLAIQRTGPAAVALAVWAVANWALVETGIAPLPFVSIALGLVGCAAVIAFAAILSKSDLMAPVRYCGTNSIVIYLAFFLPMAATRSLLPSLGIIDDIGTMSALVTVAAVIGPLVLFWAGAQHPGAVPVRAAGLGDASRAADDAGARGVAVPQSSQLWDCTQRPAAGALLALGAVASLRAPPGA